MTSAAFLEEAARYISSVHAGQLRGSRARKWQCCKGTSPPESVVLRDGEIRVQPSLKTQDDVIREMVAVRN